MFPHWPPFWQHQGGEFTYHCRKLMCPLKAFWKFLCTAIFLLKDKFCAKGKRQQVHRCGSTGLCISPCILGDSNRWVSACPASSCPAATDKKIRTEKCTNTPMQNPRQLRLCIQIHCPTWTDSLQPQKQYFPPQLLLMAVAPGAHWVNETPPTAVCGVSSSGNLGQACPAGVRVKF